MARDLRILLVDDDAVDRLLVRDAFRQARLANDIIEAASADEAMRILREDTDERPFIVLLDVRMPGRTGLAMLEELRADERLSETTVYMLTTSDSDDDIRSAYAQHASGYLTKSRAGEHFSQLIEMFAPMWRLVELPE